MQSLPQVSSYGQYSSNNYGAHTLLFSIGPVDIYFSYKTIVGFRSPRTGLVLSENLWGPTTGKHLNFISRNAKRLKRDEFEKTVADGLSQYEIPYTSIF
jgi:hypothetical protein